MPKIAPRYDDRLLRALEKLDDESQPIAETCRRVGEFAVRIGVPRPSYVHLRRLVVAERERRQARRDAIEDAIVETLAFGMPNTRRLAERLDRAEARRRGG